MLSISEVQDLRMKGKITDKQFEAYRMNRVRRAQKAVKAPKTPDPRSSTQPAEKTRERANGSRFQPRTGTASSYIQQRAAILNGGEDSLAAIFADNQRIRDSLVRTNYAGPLKKLKH